MTKLHRACQRLACQYDHDSQASVNDLAEAMHALVLKFTQKTRKGRK